jgi:organic hydroperoxide reductase OsmC/OhrA
MVTFVAFAQRLGLPILSYLGQAEAVLEFKEGSYQITRVVLRPTIEVGDPDAVALTAKALNDAHRHCIISNSIRASVEVHSVVRPRIASEA